MRTVIEHRAPLWLNITTYALTCLSEFLTMSFNIPADILDHADVLRSLYDKVSSTIDAQSVARNMFQSNALTLKELQSIQSKQKKSVKAAEQLVNIVMNQSGNVYSCFLDALKNTGQQHVYEIVVSGSYRGTHDGNGPLSSVAFIILKNYRHDAIKPKIGKPA